MRTRDKSTVDSQVGGGTVTQRYYSNDSYYNFSHGTFEGTEQAVNNFIIDELLPKSDRSTRACFHKNYKEGHVSFTRHTHNPNYTQYYQVWDNINLLEANRLYDGNTIFTLSDLRSSLDLKDEMVNAFNARAWQAMKPSLEGDVSLTNFILELSDLKQLLRLFAPSRDLFKKISEGHLTWSFGIKPMISDLSEIYSSLFNYEKRLREFVNRAETEQKRRYSETVIGEDDRAPAVYSAGGSPWWRTYAHKWKWSYKLVANMRYSYNIEELQSQLARLKALRAMLGLKFTPSVVWEAIPFSFVVDWFVNVGKWLESREDDLIEPDVLVDDYSVSYKLVFDGRIDYIYPERQTGVPKTEEKVYWAKGSIYDRRKVLPNTEGLPLTFDLLSSNQLALSASLINVRRR